MISDDEVLDHISNSLTLESWFEGKTLSVMLEADGVMRIAKLRLNAIAYRLSAADLRGEPE